MAVSATFFSFWTVRFLRRPRGRKFEELVSPQLPFCRGRWVWLKGSAPPGFHRSHQSRWSAPERQHIVWDSAKERYQFHNCTYVFQPRTSLFLAPEVWDSLWSCGLHFHALCQPLSDNFLFSQVDSATHSLPKSPALCFDRVLVLFFFPLPLLILPFMKRDFLIGEVSHPTTLWEKSTIRTGSFLRKVKELFESSVSDQADTNNNNNINHFMRQSAW